MFGVHISVFASVGYRPYGPTTQSPNHPTTQRKHVGSAPRNALKRISFALAGQQRSIEVTRAACYYPASRTFPLRCPGVDSPDFFPLALNHVLIPEPLVHQINTKHRSENVINNAHRRLRLEVAQGVCSTAILPQPLRPPSSGHVTKLIWRSGHKQLVSKTKQLQWSKGCEGI